MPDWEVVAGVGGLILTMLGAIFVGGKAWGVLVGEVRSMRTELHQAQAPVAEVDRKVTALHARFDRVETRVAQVEEKVTRHDERINALRDTQRFRLAVGSGEGNEG